MTHLDHNQIALLVYEQVQEAKKNKNTELVPFALGKFQPILNPETGQTERIAFAWCPDPDRCN